MKNLIACLFAVATLAGCTYYDYYKGGVRYTQDGDDCIYYADEAGRRFSDNVNSMNQDKKIVYRNTRCADLFNRDTEKLDKPEITRSVIAPAYVAPSAPVMPTCGCNTCGQPQPIVRRTYVMY